MAFPTLVRRLQRPHLRFLFSLSLHSQSTFSQPSHHRTLSHSFHRTLGVHFRNSPLQTLHFSTLYDPLNFEPESVLDSELRDDFLGAIKQVSHLPTEAEAISALEDSGLKASCDVVRSAIWAFREESRLALLAFNWGERLGCCDEEAWNLIIWVLGNHGKFNTAWCLISVLHRSSMNTRRAILIMIDRYAYANDPSKAMWAFQIMEKFNLSPDQKAFYASLNALCKHGYIEEAEEFMLKSKKLFPLETEGFNVILNGWCNVSVDVFEAKRVWREMSKCCILPNAESYTHIISCFSKVNNLFDSLRLHDEMKKRGWLPGIEVYNSLVSVLTSENCYNEALKFVEKMKESGLRPDSNTYNAIIRPLCKARKVNEARDMLTTMIEENIIPTTETYHAFLESSEFEETLELLIRMKRCKIGPSKETFRMILEKFFLLKQPENAMKIWTRMESYEIVPDSSHYTVTLQGLIKCGWLIRAREILAAMRSNGFVVDPKLKILLEEPVRRGSSGSRLLEEPVRRGSEPVRRGSSGSRLLKEPVRRGSSGSRLMKEPVRRGSSGSRPKEWQVRPRK